MDVRLDGKQICRALNFTLTEFDLVEALANLLELRMPAFVVVARFLERVDASVDGDRRRQLFIDRLFIGGGMSLAH